MPKIRLKYDNSRRNGEKETRGKKAEKHFFFFTDEDMFLGSTDKISVQLKNRRYFQVEPAYQFPWQAKNPS